MKRFEFWVTWLKIVSIVFSLFGISLALFSQTPIFNLLFNNQINPVFFGNDTLSLELIHFQQWAYGLLGATCTLVGILIFFIVNNAFKKMERWAWNSILVGLLGWFILDEPISLYFSVHFNAIFNLGLLTAVLLPLIFTRHYFRQDNSENK